LALTGVLAARAEDHGLDGVPVEVVRNVLSVGNPNRISIGYHVALLPPLRFRPRLDEDPTGLSLDRYHRRELESEDLPRRSFTLQSHSNQGAMLAKVRIA
jgi:hypothetical protein